MSYASKYAKRKLEQMQQSVNAAGQLIEDEVSADALKRKMLMGQIKGYEETLLEYRKELAKFDIMPSDDPALARQKVTSKSGTRVVAGSSSASSDALILGAIKHQTDYLMSFANASKDFIETDSDKLDEVLQAAQVDLQAELATLSTTASGGVASGIQTLENKLIAQSGNLTPRQKMMMANEIQTQADALQTYGNLTQAQIKDLIKKTTGLADPNQYTDTAVSASYQDLAERFGRAAGLPDVSEDKLQELVDRALTSSLRHGARAVPFEETSVELQQLTPEAQAIVAMRSTQEYKVVENALSNDGVIDKDEEANWWAFQESLGTPPEERTTIEQLRAGFGTEALLTRLEQRGYLQRGAAEAKAGRESATKTLEGMVAPDQSMERLRREAGQIYEPYAVDRFPKGLRPPKLRSKEMEPRSPLREALEAMSTDEQVMLEAAVQSQQKDFKPTDFTRQVLGQLPKGTDARTARARFQRLAEDVESSPEKARRVRSNLMAGWFQRFGEKLSKEAPEKTPKE